MKCLVDTTITDSCLSNCRAVHSGNQFQGRLSESCIAHLKLKRFLENPHSFQAALTAFEQAPPKILNDFAKESPVQLELITYFLSITEPKRAAETATLLNHDILYNLFKVEFTNFSEIKKTSIRSKMPYEKNFFRVKSNLFWNYIPTKRLCELMTYMIRNKSEANLASQFLVVLPPLVVSNLGDNAGLSVQEEKDLFISLGDNIYELPLQSPGIYPHMIKLFEDDIEVFMILSTMEQLVIRQDMILRLTEKLIQKVSKTGEHKTQIKELYSELKGIDLDLVNEILNQLFEQNAITKSERDLMSNVFRSNTGEFF